MRKVGHPPQLKTLTLALLSALAALASAAVHADQTISSATTALVNFTSDNLTITSSGSIAVPGATSIDANGAPGTLSNNGLIGGATGVNNNAAIAAILNNNGGTISGSSNAIYNNNAAAITTVNNSGLLQGDVAISNLGTITTLNNNSGGTINGGSSAIGNRGTIATLTNNGIISAGSNGVTNNGIIGTLSNSGLIASTNNQAMSNSGTITTLNNQVGGTLSGNTALGNYNGTIATLINSGNLVGNSTAIMNYYGAITTLNNNVGGTISGGATAIGNYSGTIGNLNNSGVIVAAGTGISNNSGTISTLTNNGTIRGGTYAIYNNDTVGPINNGGLIAGTNMAIYNQANLGAITNWGTIAGTIFSSSTQDLTINGSTLSSFGTLTGSGSGFGIGANNIGTIINTSSNLIFGSGKQLLNDNINVGTRTVINAAGTLQVNNLINITGNYSQNAAATLNIGVASGATANGILSDAGYGRLLVSGSATIAAGSGVALAKVSSYAFAQGQRYIVIVANSTGTNYNAGALNYSAAGYSGSVTGTSIVDGSNTMLLLTLVAGNSASTPGSSTPAGGGSSTPNNWATTPNAVSSLSGMLSYTGTNAPLMNLFNASAALSSTREANRAGAQLSPAATAVSAAQASAAPTQNVLNVAAAHVDGLRVAQAQGDSGVATGENGSKSAFWGQAFGGRANQSQRDNIAGFHADYNGLLIGADTLLGQQWRIGALASYANTAVANNGDNTGSSTHLHSYGLIGYGGYTADAWYLDFSAGAVRHQYDTTRAIDFTGFSGSAFGQHNGMQYVASVQGGYPIRLDSWMPGTVLTPIAGLSYSRLHQDAYTERGGNGAALSVDGIRSSSLKSDLGAKLEHSFQTSYGALAPSAQLSWRHEFQRSRVQSVARFAADTSGATSFTTLGPTTVADSGALALAMTLTRSNNLTLTARYTVEAASGYLGQTADVRARWQF